MNKTAITEFFHEHRRLLVTFNPHGKAPIKFIGSPINSLLIAGTPDEKADYSYALYALESGACVLLFTEYSYVWTDDKGEPDEHRRARVIRSIDDVWSFATKGRETERLVKFMDQCGEILGEKSFFYPFIV